jgi:Sulfotransferase domain
MRSLVSRMLTLAQKQRIKAFVSAVGHKPYLLNKVLVGTHHKTGTVWLKSIFRTICSEYSLHYFEGEQPDAPAQCDVFFQDHSRFELDLFESPIRGLHIIRDPRDIIVSGCFYHQKSKEQWLHKPRKALLGRTYHETISSAKTLEDKIFFEMEHAGRVTIEEITRWDYTSPSFCELKYEDLIRDTDLMVFHKAFSFLGFPGSILPGALAIAFSKSLFSNQPSASNHIRSGEVAQWEQYFTRSHKERFLELFGDVLIRLGYENNNDW